VIAAHWRSPLCSRPLRWLLVDALARTRELLDKGDPIEEVVRELRVEGFQMIESMSALINAGGVSYDDAKTAVVDSPVWADQRDRVATRRWVDPPERPDRDTVERLREACSEDPRIKEVWVTGSEMTRHDGSSDVSTDLAIVLDPPKTALRDEDEIAVSIEIITRLDAAWPTTGRRGCLWVSREMIAREEKHCVAIYSRR
jgi:hypothetical protein